MLQLVTPIVSNYFFFFTISDQKVKEAKLSIIYPAENRTQIFLNLSFDMIVLNYTPQTILIKKKYIYTMTGHLNIAGHVVKRKTKRIQK